MNNELKVIFLNEAGTVVGKAAKAFDEQLLSFAQANRYVAATSTEVLAVIRSRIHEDYSVALALRDKKILPEQEADYRACRNRDIDLGTVVQLFPTIKELYRVLEN